MPSEAHRLIPGLAERDISFYSALQGEDDLGLIIRAHIHIEHELREFVLAAAPSPKSVKFPEMEFEATLRLALILGLSEECRSAVAAIGSLRNRFAHTLTSALNEQEANNLYAALSPTLKEHAQKTYLKLNADRPSHDRPDQFKQLPPRDRVIFCLILLRSVLVAERLMVDRKTAIG
jgi:hypothetical protein